MTRSQLRLFEVDWLSDTDMERILMYRGAFVSAAAQVETILAELAIRASHHPNYVGLRPHFPRKREGRVKYLRKVSEAPGPLAFRAKRLQDILRLFEGSAKMRDRMAHARMTARSDPGMIGNALGITAAVRFMEIEARGEVIEFHDTRIRLTKLRNIAERAAFVSRATENYYAWASGVLPSICDISSRSRAPKE
jgi:hypothetical protein